ncbi:MAG: DUF1987 domain-containing protein [Bacteroidales bacterium]|nr:DUF1987 domain-containing protein [Bacteroidales bacterium]MBN2758005.1 DUF1987 domain-containing protein [Bacteroidales bacterium]
MENLEIKEKNGIQFKPEVSLNANTGLCEISGESYLEEATQFYKPIAGWVIEFIKTKKPIKFDFKLSYVNTSSSKHILYILRLLKEYQDNEGEVEANWYVESGDTDTEEDVEDYMIITGLKINIVKI